MTGSKKGGYRRRGNWPLPILALAFVTGCDSTIPTAAPPHTTELPFVAETEHFRFYAEARDALDAPRTEAHFSWLLGQLRVDVPRKVDYYKYLDLGELARATGRDAPFADADRFAVHTVEPWESLATTRLVGTLMAAPPAFFFEGLVVAHQTRPFDDAYGVVFDAQPVHRTPAIRLALGLLPRVEDVVADVDFGAVRVKEPAQLQAGSFVRRLIDTHGMTRFRDFLRGVNARDSRSAILLRFSQIYGRSLREFESDWHRFLSRRALINAPAGLSDGPQVSSVGLAAAISFSSAGSVLARMTDAYVSPRRIPYEFDVPYHFRLLINVPARNYSTLLQKPGEAEQTVGIDYGFRVDPNPVPASRLDTFGMGVLVPPLGPLGALRICNLQIAGADSQTTSFPCAEVTSGSWRNQPIPLQTNRFTVEFDATLLEWAPPTPAPPSGPTATAAQAYVDEAIRIMETSSINRQWIDWVNVRARVRQRARGGQTAADTYPAIAFAVDLLDDQHSSFRPPSGASSPSRLNSRQCEAPAVTTPTLPSDIGYVRVGGFSGSGAAAVAFADSIQDQIRATDGPRLSGWIVDLRGNTGGNMWPMVAGVGSLLGDGVAGFFISPDGRMSSWAYQDGAARSASGEVARTTQSYVPRHSNPRVAVLTDQRVGSSGEAVTISFRAREDARSFGTPTCGVSTSNVGFSLSDGAVLTLTTATLADRTKRPYGRPVRPDETLYDAEAMFRRAIAWLRTGE